MNEYNPWPPDLNYRVAALEKLIPHVHPIFHQLFAMLPKPGSEFPMEKRTAFMRAFVELANLIYDHADMSVSGASRGMPSSGVSSHDSPAGQSAPPALSEGRMTDITPAEKIAAVEWALKTCELLDVAESLEAVLADLRLYEQVIKSAGEMPAQLQMAHRAGAEEMRERLKSRIDTRLNDCLCEMKPDYDDSIAGFNEAWDIVCTIFKEEAEAAIRALPVEQQ